MTRWIESFCKNVCGSVHVLCCLCFYLDTFSFYFHFIGYKNVLKDFNYRVSIKGSDFQSNNCHKIKKKVKILLNDHHYVGL